jgi:hypothetical protein
LRIETVTAMEEYVITSITRESMLRKFADFVRADIEKWVAVVATPGSGK